MSILGTLGTIGKGSLAALEAYTTALEVKAEVRKELAPRDAKILRRKLLAQQNELAANQEQQIEANERVGAAERELAEQQGVKRELAILYKAASMRLENAKNQVKLGKLLKQAALTEAGKAGGVANAPEAVVKYKKATAVINESTIDMEEAEMEMQAAMDAAMTNEGLTAPSAPLGTL